MASSQELKRRTTSDQTQESNKEKKQKKTAMAKRGLCSLAIAGNIFLFARTDNVETYRTVSKPFWWGVHLMCLVFSIVMGLSAWLVWAEGGFHKKPNAAAIYLAHLGLSLAWDPIMFGLGASRVGLLVCLGLLASVVGCYQYFKGVNPIAGGLLKPCMAWAGFLSLLNLKIVYF